MISKKYYNLEKSGSYKEFYESCQAYKDILKALREDFYAIYKKIIKKYTAPKDIIIDGGTGYAKAFITFSAKKRKIICIDWSLSFLREAKANYKNGIFIQADLCNMPLKPNSADFIGLFDVLEHVYDVKQFFKEANNVLRKGGKILIISPNLDSPLMPLVEFYYSRKYGYKLGHEGYISLKDLFTETLRRIIIYLKSALSNSFEIRYRKFENIMEHTDDDAIFYSSYFIVKYMKTHNFKIFKNMAAPLLSPKYIFARIFPSIFITTYIIAEKV